MVFYSGDDNMGQIANRMLIEVIFKAKENNIYVLLMKPMDSKGMGEALLSGLLRAGICIVFDVYYAVRQKTRNIAMNSQRIE